MSMTKFDKVKKFLISEGFRKDDASAYNTPLINKVIRNTPVAPLRCSRLYYRRFLVGYIYVSIFSSANNKLNFM